MHILTLLHRNMGKYQISCGDIEMAKRNLGQARDIFSIIHYLKIIQKN
jgi:hypothetical protein